MSTPTPDQQAAEALGLTRRQVDPDTAWTDADLATWLVQGHRPADDKTGSTSNDKDRDATDG